MTSRGTATRLRVLALSIAISATVFPPPRAHAQGAGGQRIRQQEIFKGSNILSPGTHDDWPLKAKDKETVILAVTSAAFDPSVELIDQNGKSLGKNDDVRQGEQNALLVVRVEKGGDCHVRVTSPNATAGGQYELAVRRFAATDLALGTRATATLGKSLAHWHRFMCDANEAIVVSARAVTFAPLIEVIAPNGEPAQNELPIAQSRGSTRAVVRAAQAGAYYARIAPAQGGDALASYAIAVAPARAVPTVIGEVAAERSIEAGALDLWTFTAQAGDVVSVRAKAATGTMSQSISFVPPVVSTGKPRTTEDSVAAVVILPSDPKIPDEITAVLNQSGTYQVAVSQPLGMSARYRFSTARATKPVAIGAAANSSLNIGASQFWSFDGSPGQIVRFDASSERFDAELELYSPTGDLLAHDDDGGSGHDAKLTAQLAERGMYLLRVHSHGNGGGGPYALRQDANPTRAVTIGATAEGTLGSGVSDVWSFEGKAKQSVIVSARSADFRTKVSLFGPDAAAVASEGDGGDGAISLLAVRLPVDGKYTLWLTSQSGGGAYSIQLLEAR
jgi:hypothetical protein